MRLFCYTTILLYFPSNMQTCASGCPCIAFAIIRDRETSLTGHPIHGLHAFPRTPKRFPLVSCTFHARCNRVLAPFCCQIMDRLWYLGLSPQAGFQARLGTWAPGPRMRLMTSNPGFQAIGLGTCPG